MIMNYLDYEYMDDYDYMDYSDYEYGFGSITGYFWDFWEDLKFYCIPIDIIF